MQAFAEQHPWAREVGLALRFDGMGSSGALELVNTAGANTATIDGWLHATPDVRGSSLMREVHALAPGAPRIGALALLAVPVLQFANRGRPFDHAGVSDTPGRLESATLQHTGESMLRLARHFGGQRLAPPGTQTQAARGQVYFTLPLLGTVHYSGDLVWTFTRLTGLLLVGAVCVAMQRSQVRYPALLRAVFLMPCVAVALGMLAWQLWMHVPALHRAWNPDAPQHARQALLYLAGLCGVCSALFIVAQRR
ncbi:hypothetical protein [Massilia sp. Se16.2.3]|uniref:hypothetical protein n=1 Tax=Massilia sp. Se16.2.3 TaxID=2709303 RepID=UPI001E5EC69C|nr:hypothetical protein [Massilia sp. Se16.2.3]